LFAKFHRFISQSILVAQRYDFLGKSGWNRVTMCCNRTAIVVVKLCRRMWSGGGTLTAFGSVCSHSFPPDKSGGYSRAMADGIASFPDNPRSIYRLCQTTLFLSLYHLRVRNGVSRLPIIAPRFIGVWKRRNKALKRCQAFPWGLSRCIDHPAGCQTLSGALCIHLQNWSFYGAPSDFWCNSESFLYRDRHTSERSIRRPTRWSWGTARSLLSIGWWRFWSPWYNRPMKCSDGDRIEYECDSPYRLPDTKHSPAFW